MTRGPAPARPSTRHPGSGLERRFHIGDLLAVVMKSPSASPRGIIDVAVLQCYMAGRPPVPAAALVDFHNEIHAYVDDFAAAILATYPELGAFTHHAAPPYELLGLWLRRREREFGRYLPAPRLSATHPLRGGAAASATRPPPSVPPPVMRELSELCARFAQLMRVSPVAPAVGAAARGPRPCRRFHVGDLLSVVMDRTVARRGLPGGVALLRFMADRPAADTDVLAAHYEDFRTAVLAAYPELGTYTGADEPPAELLDVWLRRREREFGRYRVAPRLPASHPLRAPPPPADAPAPAPTPPRETTAARSDPAGQGTTGGVAAGV